MTQIISRYRIDAIYGIGAVVGWVFFRLPKGATMDAALSVDRVDLWLTFRSAFRTADA